MTMFRKSFLLAVLLLSGCAGASAAAASIKRIAVISMIGDKFTVQKISLNPFDGKQKTIPIGGWGIDRFVVDRVRKVLAGRFEVRPLAYQPVADANDVAVKIVEGVRAQSAAKDIDAYIVVTKSTVQDNSRQRYYGLGIVEHALVGHRVELYVLYDITVVDGHDLSIVTSTQKTLALGPLLNPPTRSTWRELDESWMPATLEAAQNMRLKSAVTELLDRNLPSTIDSLKLRQ
jgi:serine protease inhibitor ecotin